MVISSEFERQQPCKVLKIVYQLDGLPSVQTKDSNFVMVSERRKIKNPEEVLNYSSFKSPAIRSNLWQKNRKFARRSSDFVILYK